MFARWSAAERTSPNMQWQTKSDAKGELQTVAGGPGVSHQITIG